MFKKNHTKLKDSKSPTTKQTNKLHQRTPTRHLRSQASQTVV